MAATTSVTRASAVQVPELRSHLPLEYEVDTVYFDSNDLSGCVPVYDGSFECVACGREIPGDEPWVGPKTSPRFGVTWAEHEASEWQWAAYRPASNA